MRTTHSTIHAPRTPSVSARPLAVLIAALSLLATLVPPALADGGGYDVVPHTEGLFYGDLDADTVLFVGATPAQFCAGDEPTHEARLSTRDDGTTTIKVDSSDQPAYLYATPLGGPGLIDATCGALYDGDDATVPLAPVASGQGQVRMRLEISPDGTVHVVNSTVGSVVTDDGTTWRVRGWADLMVVDGAPVGSPDEFQGLRLARTGA